MLTVLPDVPGLYPVALYRPAASHDSVESAPTRNLGVDAGPSAGFDIH
ncbi:hypothetical protein GTW71_22270 [Streptomyces sp. SID6041]|nr:hypothetical protein [Streptomyces sp. SID6041]